MYSIMNNTTEGCLTCFIFSVAQFVTIWAVFTFLNEMLEKKTHSNNNNFKKNKNYVILKPFIIMDLNVLPDFNGVFFVLEGKE